MSKIISVLITTVTKTSTNEQNRSPMLYVAERLLMAHCVEVILISVSVYLRVPTTFDASGDDISGEHTGSYCHNCPNKILSTFSFAQNTSNVV